ncbi:MAG TPA: 4-hydroxy-tetrahydrodipicolinate synthase [Candidatus Bathyarchaeia archaeon]|nr:4-hydroxy-tetrahydrodipicolinate synthase [Candidatus Bathyarchaeia archaeon]
MSTNPCPFSGSMVALVTPFCDGEVDYAALERLVEEQILGGQSALVPCGSTGESATLSHEEHSEVVRAVIRAARGRVPVIAGTGSNSTREAIRLTREAEESGAAGALLISPYYNRPTQGGIVEHYRAVAAATKLPLIVYNIPGRTGSTIEPQTLARLAEIDNIVGLKDSTGSLDRVIDTIAASGSRLAVFSGDDSLTLPIIAVGGRGVISALANVVPREMSAMANAALAGSWDEARRRQYDLLDLMRACFLETNPIPVKAALAMLGRCRDELRLPLLPMSPGPRAQLRAALLEHKLPVAGAAA